MPAATQFTEIKTSTPQYWGLLLLLAILTAVGIGAAHHMDVEGHHISGMNNQIVWGLPHVFAIFLIVAASGALNLASIASVFGKVEYKPLARFSAVLSIALLVGGLAVLLLDLGRPDRLIVAITHYNFRSIFAWNMILYSGFIVIVLTYLWFYRHRADLPVVDDGTPLRALEPTRRYVRIRLATDTDQRHRLHLRFPRRARGL